MKHLIMIVFAGAATLILESVAFAAGWVQDQETGYWKYDLGNGQYYAAESSMPKWEWLDGNEDGVAECYAFDQEGRMYADAFTPDGYKVNMDGAWVVDGLVQTMEITRERNILIAYFSHTGTTEEAAKQIQKITGGDLFEIKTVEAYPDSYQEAVDVARRERDTQARPLLSSWVEHMEDYNILIVGYPIWWHTTPMAVNTFLESYDLTEKMIFPFCTSGGSDVEESMEAVRNSSGNGKVGIGLTANNISAEEIQNWLSTNGIR